MINKEKIDAILNIIRNNKFNPYNISYGDGYFIFEFGENTVCHFMIKGIKNWKFGIWINTDENKKDKIADVFAQYIPCIDKFKPSRSHYCMEIDNWKFENDFNYDLIGMIKEIKQYPYVAYYHDITSEKWHVSTPRAFSYFIKTRLEDNWYEFKKWIKTKKNLIATNIKLFYLRLIDKRILDFEITDKNTKTYIVYPRYEIKILWKEDSISDIELEKWEKKWFKKYRSDFSRPDYFEDIIE